METRHIRLDYEEALNAKKHLLSSELNLLQLMKTVKNYRTLRKKEITSKNKLKRELTSLKTKINLIESTFPKLRPNQLKIKKVEKKIRDEENEDIQDELEEIKAKLKKLDK